MAMSTAPTTAPPPSENNNDASGDDVCGGGGVGGGVGDGGGGGWSGGAEMGVSGPAGIGSTEVSLAQSRRTRIGHVLRTELWSDAIGYGLAALLPWTVVAKAGGRAGMELR